MWSLLKDKFDNYLKFCFTFSCSKLPTTEASLPSVDGPGDKEARKSGKDKGVAIGAGVGGAVVFGIIVIGLITVFCRRRRSAR